MAQPPGEELREKVDGFPRKPGVYLMKDARNEVIYVGKAKDLRSRVRSYFQAGRDEFRLISEQFGQVADIDIVVTNSEAEALLLENNFIKQFRPRYNVLFRDDKSFVSIRIDRHKPWPRPRITRNLDDPDALYFGPYASAQAARRTLRTIQEIFPLRRCSLRQCRERSRPCLYGEMDKCIGPCIDGVTEEDYNRIVEQVVSFLKGQADHVLDDLRDEMQEASESLEFERAARLRDRIQAVERTLQAQHVASSAEDVDRDVFGLHATDKFVTVAVLFVRGGNVRDATTYRFGADLDTRDEIFGAFLRQFYAATRFIPEEVLLPVDVEDRGLLEEVLGERKGRKVRLHVPQRGMKKRLVELADGNAATADRTATTEQERAELEMESLREILALSNAPRHIECYDISTTQGREAVGSRVVFRDARQDKASYRRYKIREVEGQDDFAMMHEVLTRRLSKTEDDPVPDLLVVDGGKGQLGVAVRVMQEHGIRRPDVVGLAKARTARKTGERVFKPGRSDAIPLPEGSHALHLLARVRDEAHRFAVSYHRKLRKKSTMQNPLREVKGVGKVLARRLLEHFGGLNKVQDAPVEELARVKGVSRTLAQAIHDHYHAGTRGC
jgi:excinuclease ABC subunit C